MKKIFLITILLALTMLNAKVLLDFRNAWGSHYIFPEHEDLWA